MTEYNNGQKKFEKIIVDSDTALYMAARSVEEDYVLVKCVKTGQEREFKNISEFQGLTRKGEVGGWLKNMVVDFLGVELSRDAFEITQHVRLKPSITNHLESAELQFSYFVKSIKDLNVADDYVLCIGGTGNFRYEVAKILPYKGERKEKPIVFQELKDKVFTQYKNKLDIANNCESDDTLGIYSTINQAHFRKTGKYKYVLGYIDKDLKQLWGACINLNKKEEGVQFITPFEAAKHFATQLIKGDKGTDNIQGLPDLSLETKIKYSLRKVKGCGDVAADTILSGCTEAKQLFERVVECYRSFYGDGTHPVGELTYTWKDFLKENALLLWMQRKKDQRFDIFEDLFKPLKIEYEP
jgi:hypothetical protein